MFKKFGYGFAHSTDPCQTIVYCAAWSGSTLHSDMSVQIFRILLLTLGIACLYVCFSIYIYALYVGDLPRSLLRTVCAIGLFFVFDMLGVGEVWH